MKFWQPKKKGRGASSERKSSSYDIDFRWFYWLFNGVVVALIVTGSYYVMMTLIERPVTRVAVKGDFHYVDKTSVVTQVTPYLDAGFVMLDLDGMRESLLQRPWIFDVTINRQWPDQIVIGVVEQTPIARWGEDGFLNHRGVLFTPAGVIDELLVSSLPLLAGPKETTLQVMEHYRELADMLNQQNLQVNQLKLDPRGSWIAVVADAPDTHKVPIFLGASDVMSKMRRFVSVYHLTLESRFEQVGRIDMRYTNGLAVQWDRRSAS